MTQERKQSPKKGKAQAIQCELALFPRDITTINDRIGFGELDGMIFYVNGSMPLFSHSIEDIASRKVFLVQLYKNGLATQAELNRAFGMNPINMKRWVKTYETSGASGFFVPKKAQKKGHVLTEEVQGVIRECFSEGMTPKETAEKLGLKQNTLEKAIRVGTLPKPQKKTL